MANAEKVVDYVSSVLSGLIPKPADAVLKPLLKPVGDSLKAWITDKETQKDLLEAAQKAESDFREQAKNKFGNDKLTQAVASFPLHNGELFQSALQSLPSHFNETILATHLSNDLSKYWSGKFTLEEIRAGTALYLDCLRLRLLRVNGFADVVTRLAILRTDRRTEDILGMVKEILELLSGLRKKEGSGIVFRSLRQLPPPPADFIGREEIIKQLLSDFNTRRSATISGLTGMGGIGKTALGLVVANQLSEKYPDAQIFLDLKGTTTPLTALDVARHVILSFEPTEDFSKMDETNMFTMYHSILHGKKALLFFDNARSADQIASLRPPETCAMLITSRWTFSVPGLGSRHMDVMSKSEANGFLQRLCPRIGDKSAELAKACAYLPLALRIAGSFLQVNSDWPIEKYLAKLNDRKKRLETLKQSREDADLASEPDLLATFEVSYNRLSPKDQKCWRILGVFPAPFAAFSAQVMWGLDEDETMKILGSLIRYSLLEYDQTSTRYYLHDFSTDFALSRMKDDEERDARLAYAFHFMEVMKLADELYSQGGDMMLQGLAIFDSEWTHISTAHDWSAKEIDHSQVAAEICNYTFAPYCLELRLPPSRIIEWLETALNASRILKDKGGEGTHLGNLGGVYLELGDLNKAVEFFEQQLVIARKLKDRGGESHTIANLGNVNLTLGNARKAIDYYEQAITLMRELGDHKGEATCLSNLGYAYSDLNKNDKALEYYEQALEVDREVGDLAGEGRDFLNLGAVFKALGKVNEAIKLLEQALDVTRKIGDKRAESSISNNLGLAYMELDHVNKAIEFFEQQLIIARELDDRKQEGCALTNLGIAYDHLGNAHKAVEFHKQALGIAHEVGDRRGESVALGNLGMAFGDLGEVHKAIEFYEQALTIARETGDRRSEGILLVTLGIAYGDKLGDFHRTIEFFEQALTIARETGDRREEGILLGRLGSVYGDKLGDVHKAIEFYEQALTIDREIGNRSSAGDVLDELGIAYAEMDDVNKAIMFFEQHLELSREIGDQRGEGLALGNLGKAYLLLDDPSKAIKYLNEAISIAETIGDQINLGTWFVFLGIAHYGLKEKKKGVGLVKKALVIFKETESPNTDWARNILKEWGVSE